MATPLHFITSNDSNTSSTPTNIWPTQPPTHYPILRPLPNSNTSTTTTTTTTSKPRGRKSGNNNTNGKSQNGATKEKIVRRGVGMAELERLRILGEHSHSSHHTLPPPPTPTTHKTDHHRVNPLAGVPVIRYCIPGQPITDPWLTHRVGIPESSSAPYYSELPSMPNPFQIDHSTLSFKKKRVIGEESVGFSRGYNGNFGGGYDLKNGDNYNHYMSLYQGFPNHHATTNNGSEVVAIHRKWSGSGNVMMEYGFFPGKSESDGQQENMIKFDRNNNDYINNYYNKMEDLNLKMGFHSDNSSASPSPSSSLSSLTTATTATNSSNTFVDLSLKLSNY